MLQQDWCCSRIAQGSERCLVLQQGWCSSRLQEGSLVLQEARSLLAACWRLQEVSSMFRKLQRAWGSLGRPEKGKTLPSSGVLKC